MSDKLLGRNARVAVIGHGSWATALVKIFLENTGRLGWYIRNEEVLEYVLQHKANPRYLRDVHFYDGDIKASSDLNQIVTDADILILATPSAYLKDILAPLTVSLKDKFVVSAIKGIIPDGYVTVAEYMNEKYDVPFERIGIVTGPCHAEEVALERLSYLTVVCSNPEDSKALGEKIRSRYINVTYSTDIYGTEYAAILKNIYAIAVGIAVGLGYGDNFNAVLISNAAIEINRFLSQVYPFERNTSASAYLGDLLVTSYSQFSRNRTFGAMIGKGYSVRTAKIEMSMVAEGYFASECIIQINKKQGIEMPIAECIYNILYRNAIPSVAMKELTKKLI